MGGQVVNDTELAREIVRQTLFRPWAAERFVQRGRAHGFSDERIWWCVEHWIYPDDLAAVLTDTRWTWACDLRPIRVAYRRKQLARKRRSAR